MILKEIKKTKSNKSQSPLAPFISSGIGSFVGGLACGYILSNNTHILPLLLGGIKKNFLPSLTPLDEEKKLMMMKMMMSVQSPQPSQPPLESVSLPQQSS